MLDVSRMELFHKISPLKKAGQCPPCQEAVPGLSRAWVVIIKYRQGDKSGLRSEQKSHSGPAGTREEKIHICPWLCSGKG